MRIPSRLALVETALAIALWAVSFIWIKIALRSISPVTLIVLRYGLAAVVLTGFAAWWGDLRRLQRSDLPGLLLLGAVGVALQQLLQVSGQATASAGGAAFLAATAPAFLAAMAAIFLREPLRPQQAVGVLLATGGAALVASGGRVSLDGQVAAPGNLLVLLSAVVWAAYTILNRRVVQGRPPLLVTAGMMVAGCLLVLPLFAVQQGWKELAGLSSSVWAVLAAIGLLSTALPYLLYTHALQQAEASRLAAIQNLEPLIAVLFAALVLGEPLTWAVAAGGAGILAGISLAEGGPAEKKVGVARGNQENPGL